MPRILLLLLILGAATAQQPTSAATTGKVSGVVSSFHQSGFVLSPEREPENTISFTVNLNDAIWSPEDKSFTVIQFDGEKLSLERGNSVTVLYRVQDATKIVVSAVVHTAQPGVYLDAREVRQLAYAGEQEEAIQIVRFAVEAAPKSVSYRILLATLLSQAASPEALEQARQAVSLGPDSAEAHATLGILLASAKNYEEGVKELQRSVELDPKLASAHFRLGLAYKWTRRFDPEIQEMMKALELNPDDETACFELALAYQMKGSLKDAERSYQACISRNPQDPAPYVNVAQIYMGTGREEEAVTYYRKLLRINPEIAIAWNNLGWLYATSKNPKVRDPAQALECALRAVSLTKESEASFLDTLAEACYVNREYNKAVEAEKKAILLRPEEESFRKSLEKYAGAKEDRPSSSSSAPTSQSPPKPKRVFTEDDLSKMSGGISVVGEPSKSSDVSTGKKSAGTAKNSDKTQILVATGTVSRITDMGFVLTREVANKKEEIVFSFDITDAMLGSSPTSITLVPPKGKEITANLGDTVTVEYVVGEGRNIVKSVEVLKGK